MANMMETIICEM